ncbi:MAG: ATP-dependent RecD-like DNA helicase [Clostridia bacterium]|nr:ATP-dependent RecD-like DNA helicase [Clostridia bacterium]
MPKYMGMIRELIFRNEDNGYSIISVKPEHGESFTAVGIIPFAEEGDYISVEGEWTQHLVYGDQLKVSSFEFYEPGDRKSIEKYLSSGAISGIGESTARLISERFGADTLKIMDSQPERLLEIRGIGKAKLKMIVESYNERRGSHNALMHFLGLGISPSLAKRIYDTYKQDAVLVARAEPYRLCDEIRGIGFRTADRIALAEGYALNDERRLRSGIKYVLNESLNGEGHTYLPEETFLKQAASILSVDAELIQRAASQLAMRNELVFETMPEGDAVFLKQAYDCEADIAVRLSRMLINAKNENARQVLVPDALSDGTKLSSAQKSALETALTGSVTIITGGPGTGKTTLIRGLIDLAASRLKVLLCAPTGRAAKRMSEATGAEAATIHRLLEYGQGENAGFAKNEDDKLKADVVIVDETSMVDIFLMRALLKALPGGVRLILTGDADQLPSVGAGNVLRDMISSGCVPVVRLTEVFRQSGQSAIVMNAHRINRGEMPVMNAKDSDFFMEKMPDAASTARSVCELVTRRLPAYMKLDPLRDIQVMAPMKKGEVGVHALNRMLQEKLNPLKGNRQILRGETAFRPGDKVMQTKNDYSLGWTRGTEAGQGVFNGDIGYITALDAEEKTLTVRFDDDREAKYDRDMMEELELSYCISVHKSQGSEFGCVVVPLLSGPPMLMTRNLLYTAVTRAKKLVVLTGRTECVYAMIKNDHIQARYSSLALRLKKLSGAVC